jgi:hypothetical protein
MCPEGSKNKTNGFRISVGHSGGSAGYRYREIIFHPASLPRNAALGAFAPFSSRRD